VILFSTYFRRRSQDNGATWSVPEVIFETIVAKEGTWRYTERVLLHDEGNDKVFFIYNYALYGNNGYSSDRDATFIQYDHSESNI